MDSTRTRIIALLGQGIQQSVVASACGVTPGWISQLLEDAAVREEVAKLRASSLQAAVTQDEELETIEAQALKIVKSKLAFVRTASEAAKIYSTLNRANRKLVAPVGETINAAGRQITVTLPAAASIHIQVNQQNQVVEIDGRSLATLPSSGLAGLAAKRPSLGLQTADDVISREIISTAVTARKLQAAELQRADETLQKVESMEVLFNGVPCVI